MSPLTAHTCITKTSFCALRQKILFLCGQKYSSRPGRFIARSRGLKEIVYDRDRAPGPVSHRQKNPPRIERIERIEARPGGMSLVDHLLGPMRSMRSMRWDLFSVIGGPRKRYAVKLTRMPGHMCLPELHSAASVGDKRQGLRKTIPPRTERIERIERFSGRMAA
jgi:hypothetical protein